MENKATPYINKNYYCKACGNKSGECDPETSLCFHCGADDWEPIDGDQETDKEALPTNGDAKNGNGCDAHDDNPCGERDHTQGMI